MAACSGSWGPDERRWGAAQFNVCDTCSLVDGKACVLVAHGIHFPADNLKRNGSRSLRAFWLFTWKREECTVGRDEIELDVQQAIIDAACWVIKKNQVSLSRVPSKPIAQSGLGLRLNSYRGLLRAIITTYMPKKALYAGYQYPIGLPGETLNAPLTDLRYALTNDLYARAQVPARQRQALRRSVLPRSVKVRAQKRRPS